MKLTKTIRKKTKKTFRYIENNLSKFYVMFFIIMLFLICVAETFDIFVFPVISGAYYSTVYASGNPLPTNYIVAGTYNYITDTITINVPQNNSYYDEVMKHELCHRAQYQRNSSMSNYFREVECYIKERV